MRAKGERVTFISNPNAASKSKVRPVNKVIFIIRKDIEEEFRSVIGDRIEKHAKVYYAFQDLHDLPEGYSVPEGRTKPWGTAQAVLCAKKYIDCPFVVINADDFYGADGFKKVYDYLVNEMDEKAEKLDMCMAGFVLGNTLSDNGTVTRGVCRTDEATGELISVTETYEIAEKDGKVTGLDKDGNEVALDMNDRVSMNMWGLPASFLDVLEQYVSDVRSVIGYEIPLAIDHVGHIGVTECIKLAKRAEKYNIAWIEDMLPWQMTEGYKRLAAATCVPLCTGEDIYLKENFIPLLESGALGVIHPDILSTGGILETKKIGDMAQDHGVAMAIHMAETPIL